MNVGFSEEEQYDFPAMQTTSLDRDRLSVLTAAILLALSMTKLLEAPTRSLRLFALGSQVGFDLSATTIMELIVLGLGITAAESLVRSHPLARQGKLGRSTMFWIVPGLLVLSLATWLTTIQDAGLWTAGLLLSSVLIPVALAAEFVSVSGGQEEHNLLRWGQVLLIHLLTVLIFTRILDFRTRSLLSASAVFLTGTLLSARLLWPVTGKASEAFTYGLIAGVLLGLMTWVMNYGRLSSLQGGLFLLALFYAVSGLLHQHIEGRLNRRVVLEYGMMSLIALVAILILF